VDLRAVGGNGFITFDYSDDPPSVYAGDACSRGDLRFSNLRSDEEIEQATGKLKGGVTGFDCPSCGASLEYHAGFGETVACSYCKAVVGLEGDRRTVVLKQDELAQRQPFLPLGSKGAIRGGHYEVIGFMSRSDGEGSEWEEYILFSKNGGFMWLTHSDDDWYRRCSTAARRSRQQVYHAGKLYRQQVNTRPRRHSSGIQLAREDRGSSPRHRMGRRRIGAARDLPGRSDLTTSAKILSRDRKILRCPSQQPKKTETGKGYPALDHRGGGGLCCSKSLPNSWAGSFVALIVAALALWAPKRFFPGE
jgi:hypothetical protein